MQVVLELLAEEDLGHLYDFYELQEGGAGDYLLQMLDRTLSRLSRNHGFHPLRHGFHRVQVERFPIGVFYRMGADCIEVAAVLDLRRDPREIARRLSSGDF